MNEIPSPITGTEYRGPKDVGRAESLYRSALTKPDLDYSTQLLFTALVANAEHEAAFHAILAKIPELTSAKKKIAARVADLLNGSPADDFIKALALYVGTPAADQALACTGEAAKIGLGAHAVTMANHVLRQWEEAKSPIKIGSALRLLDVLESTGQFEQGVRASQIALRAFPEDQVLKEREKNILAKQYLKGHTSSGNYRENLQDRARQEASQRPSDPSTRLAELEQHYLVTRKLDDFRELMRALREAPAARREEALSALQDGFDRFGEKDILWFIREIKLDRRWAEVRVHEQLLKENASDQALRSEHSQLERDVLREHIDHLYEVASSLPPGPDRYRREMELTRKLFAAGRFEESVKQAQRLKARPEYRLDAWVIMAKSFVQLGLSLEAGACFESILAALQTDLQGSPERILDAKYSYALFLTEQAEKKHDTALAAQARQLCADVTLEDIDYRGIRELSARSESQCRGK